MLLILVLVRANVIGAGFANALCYGVDAVGIALLVTLLLRLPVSVLW